MARLTLSGDKDGSGWVNLEFLCVVSLVNGYPDAPSRIDVKKRLPGRNGGKSLHVRHCHGSLVNLDGHLVPELVPQLLEFLPGNIRDQRTVRVIQPYDVSLDPIVAGSRGPRGQPHELRHYRARDGVIHSH